MTLSVAYLSVLAHRRNREQQGHSLRAQALEIQSLIDPIPLPLPPTRSEIAAAERAASVEVLKDHWNEEVGKAVRWVQHTDWDGVRGGVEANLNNLWAKATGQSPAENLKAAEEAVAPVAQQAKTKTQQQVGSIREATRGAFDTAKSTGRSVEEAAQSKALEARLKTKQEASKIGQEIKDTASEAKGGFFSFLSKGKEKAAELVEIAKSTVGIAERETGKAIDGLTFTVGMSPVQKALHQRFAKADGSDTRTAAEVLRQRYVAIDAQDNSSLRGL